MDASKLTLDGVEKIKDQNQLLEIIKNPDLDTRVRIKAVDNIEDKSILADYAYDEDIFLRMQAVRQVKDDEIFEVSATTENVSIVSQPIEDPDETDGEIQP